MSTQQNLEKVGSDLKEGLDKIGGDLSHIKADVINTRDSAIRKVRSKAEELTSNVAEQLENQMELMQHRLDEISDSVKVKLRSVDQNLHDRPYWYLAAAAVFGLGLGLYARGNFKAAKHR